MADKDDGEIYVDMTIDGSVLSILEEVFKYYFILKASVEVAWPEFLAKFRDDPAEEITGAHDLCVSEIAAQLLTIQLLDRLSNYLTNEEDK